LLVKCNWEGSGWSSYIYCHLIREELLGDEFINMTLRSMVQDTTTPEIWCKVPNLYMNKKLGCFPKLQA